MNFKRLFILLFAAITNLNSCFCFVEYFAAAAVGVGSYIYNILPGNYCTNKEIPANFNALENSLKKKLFGQPLVTDTLMHALRSHWSENHKPNKALTMSFHGGPGVGKNYVAKFMQEALYSRGLRSMHVHNFIARLHFPEDRQASVYRSNLREWIIGNVTKCPKQLFIFDEVNSMPPGVLDAIKPFIDYNRDINGVSFREAIFVFLSNTGTNILNQHVYELWRSGRKREDLKLYDFEKLIAKGSFNEEGGFQNSETISSNLIDHYIPFLPLMEPHVRMCIKEEFERRGYKPTEIDIKEVMEFIDWAPESIEVFAKTGCKRISQKVALLTY